MTTNTFRNILIIALIAGFIHTAISLKSDFVELRVNRINNIETALNQ